jgi:lactate dehydrogenase-like 2-hydroxyacid dehydrogenase
MFNKEKIAKMKKGVIIVNNARGAIMDTQAVADACSSGHIAGKILYSFHQSSLSTSMLQDFLQLRSLKYISSF